jgi:uncharacterized protein YdeI (YjbR/CyaY-like superfamily)
MAPNPIFFVSPAEFRQWLERHHAKVQELWVGFHKRSAGRPSLTWPESVDCALSFGWIDGVRKSIDAGSYRIRFTPRKPTSIWSAINLRRVAELRKMGLMHPAGIAAFERRRDDKSRIYSYEQRKTARLPAAFEKQFRANHEAWKFFQAQPPWYRRIASFWVISARKEETKAKRMATLIDDSTRQRTIKPLTRPKKTRKAE